MRKINYTPPLTNWEKVGLTCIVMIECFWVGFLIYCALEYCYAKL